LIAHLAKQDFFCQKLSQARLLFDELHHIDETIP
jgi:hypothetical protein